MNVQEATACLFVPITGAINEILDDRRNGPFRWSAGPMPFEIPSPSGESIRGQTGDVTNYETRSQYWNQRFSTSLYGSAESKKSQKARNPIRRWHLQLHENQELEKSTFCRMEIQRYPYDDNSAWLMIHLELDRQDSASALSNAIRFFKLNSESNWEKPAWWSQCLGEKVEIDVSGRVRSVSHVYFTQKLEEIHPWAAEWDSSISTPFNSWAFSMATGIKSVPTLKTLQSGTLQLSQDWSCMILRDGCAFIGVQPSKFHSSGAIYVSSIYADAFVAGLIQLKQASSLSEELLSASAAPESKKILNLQEKVLKTKAEFWMANPARSSTIAQRIIDEFRHQHSLDESMNEINLTVKDLTNFQLATSGHHRDTQAHTFALIAALVLPMSLFTSIVSSIPEHKVEHVVVAICSGLLFSSFLSLIFWTRWRKLKSK